jgi:hypothetical protein
MARPKLSKLQNITFRQKYLWDIEFITPPIPAPFNDKFFPATGITETIFSIQNHTVELLLGTFAFPKNSSIGDLPFQVTFIDDENSTIETWLHNWYKFTYPDNDFVRRVSEVAGSVKVSKENSKFRAIESKFLYVILDGELQFTGESETGLDIITQSFKIVGSTGSHA